MADNRQRGRFAGFSLYLSKSDVFSDAEIKSSTLCYENSLPLPNLNFTAICFKQGRYVIYYNERLEGATYPTGYEINNVFTELCEVKVQGKYVSSIVHPVPYHIISLPTFRIASLDYCKICFYVFIVSNKH